MSDDAMARAFEKVDRAIDRVPSRVLSETQACALRDQKYFVAGWSEAIEQEQKKYARLLAAAQAILARFEEGSVWQTEARALVAAVAEIGGDGE